MPKSKYRSILNSNEIVKFYILLKFFHITFREKAQRYRSMPIPVYLFEDAMGANLVNTMAEKCAPRLEELSKGRALLKILSNLCPDRIAKVSATFTRAEIYPKDPTLGGAIVARIVEAYHFASADPFRATTHNKGIMNAVTAVALATGQDTRAIEAGKIFLFCLRLLCFLSLNNFVA